MALIAFDLATNMSVTNTSATHTFSHTCTGSNVILFVHAFNQSNADTITSCTYNGVAMTLITKQVNSTDRFLYMFYLINPATGANNVVITANTSANNIGGGASSYTGVKQLGQPDASTSKTASGTTITTNLTTISDSCWVILFTTTSAAVPAASTNSTLRTPNNVPVGGEKIFDSNGVVSPAGSFSMAITGSGGAIGVIMASFSPNGVVTLIDTVTDSDVLIPGFAVNLSDSVTDSDTQKSVIGVTNVQKNSVTVTNVQKS